MNSRIARKVFSKGPTHPSFKKADKILTKLGGPYRMTIDVYALLRSVITDMSVIDGKPREKAP